MLKLLTVLLQERQMRLRHRKLFVGIFIVTVKETMNALYACGTLKHGPSSKSNTLLNFCM
jgi:hypothetical protein